MVVRCAAAHHTYASCIMVSSVCDADSGESGPSDSTSSISDSVTIWGPGALTGKLLKGFGALVLRGVERVIIQCRLARALPSFPHTDTATPRKIARIYDDILELARPGMGSRPAIRRQALRVVLMQIGSRETFFLIQGLKHWPVVEMKFFFTEVMACLPCAWVEIKRDATHLDLSAAYLSAQPHAEQHPAISFLNFISQLTQVNHHAGEAVLSAGLPDMLLRLYFQDILPQYVMRTKERRSPLLSACNAALVVLSSRPAARKVLFQHPLCILWPKSHQSLFMHVSPPSVDDPLKRRQLMWKRLERPLVKRRLDAVLDVIMDWTTFGEITVDLVDACGDLVEFLRSDLYDVEIAECALAHMFTCIALGHDIWRVLNFVLAHSSYKDILNVFLSIIRRFLPLTTLDQNQDSTPLVVHSFVMSRSESLHLLDCFIGFAITASQHSEHTRRALFDAGLPTLLFPLLGLKYGQQEERTGSARSFAPVVCDKSKLLNSIRTRGLGDLPVEPVDDWSRVLMCQQALEVLCGVAYSGASTVVHSL